MLIIFSEGISVVITVCVGKREFTDGEVDWGRRVIAEEVDDEDEGKQQQNRFSGRPGRSTGRAQRAQVNLGRPAVDRLTVP